jgi:hypothetical protein
LDGDNGEDEVGRGPPGFDRGQCIVAKLLVLFENELDLLIGLLLEGGNDLPDRLVLLVVLSLLPPHYEVGALGAKWRHYECHGQKDGSGVGGKVKPFPCHGGPRR